MSNNWKKPQDYENRVPSSVHHLSQVKSTTMFQGLNYPILFQKVLAGDRWSIDMADLIQSDPFLAPVKGAYRLTFSVWYESDFNLYGWMRDNDQENTSELLQKDRHRFNIPAVALGVRDHILVSSEVKTDGSYYPANPNSDPTFDPDFDSEPDKNWASGMSVSSSYGIDGLEFLPDFRNPLVSGPFRISSGTSEVDGVLRGGCVGRGSLLDYVGFAPGFQGSGVEGGQIEFYESYAADYILAYLDIMRCGFLNTQTRGSDGSSFIPMIGAGNVLQELQAGPSSSTAVTGDSIFLNLSSRQLDGFFRWLRNQEDPVFFDQNEDFPLYFQSDDFTFDPDGIPFGSDRYYRWLFNTIVRVGMFPNGGLCAAQYRPDVYRNLLSTDVGKTKSYVQTDSSGRFTIDTLRFQNKLQRVIDRLDISGGRISSWLRTLWGVETRRRFTTPELLGVTSHILDPSTITALSQTGDVGAPGSTDVGQLRGNIDKLKEHKRINFVASEPGTIVVIAQLVPLVSYCQNIDPSLRRTSFSDDYNPEFAQLGFQDVPMSDYSCLTTTQFEGDYNPSGEYNPPVDRVSDVWTEVSGNLNDVVGRNIAWVHYMTGTNRCHGEFSNLGSRDYWVFQRRFTRYFERKSSYYPAEYSLSEGAYYATDWKDLITLGSRTYISPYVDPLDYQYPFADQTLLDPHFQLDVAFNLRVVRKIGKRFMPNLERND